MTHLYLTLSTVIVVLGSSLLGTSWGQKLDSSVASDIFNNKMLRVPNNVKNFVILIPNEAHESPKLPKDQRLINQPYVPQNLVIGPNTSIIWFAGDVGHTRKVTLTDENSNKIYNSILHFNSTSKPLSLNQTGKYTYSESKANKEDPKFVMKGTITVTGNSSSINSDFDTNNSTKNNFDNIAVIMVPTRDIEKQTATLTENGVDTLGQYSFKDLRETGGGGANQTLLVLGTDNPVNKLSSVLEKITSTLPYS